MKTIAIANQKGGTGKTTTAYNLGIALTQQGYRVLMVDFDPQGNLSCYCGIPPEQDLEQTITELLMKVAYEKPLSNRECVYQSKRTDDSAPQVDFIPSNLRLASFELAMGTMMCREVLLKTCLEQYSSQYDYCIIDCSPSVGLLLTNALSAANEVIIPMQAQPFSVVGMSQLTNSISSVQRKINPGLHMLRITNDGRKLALDQRLMNPLLPDDPGSKANACVDKVYEIWEKTKEQRSTQMIFCDLSTPKEDGFDVYNDVRDKLVAKGIPKEEVQFIHDADTETKKAELFGKVRNGTVRVLMGSTQKMGAGTNVQTRLIALHHLDCPWRPADIAQRNGRMVRQGNMNKEVSIFIYVTESTFDSYSWQLVENKQKFISQIMTSKSPARSCEDLDEAALTYAEVKALAAGNPMIKEKMDLDIQVARLRTLKAAYTSQHYRLEDAIAVAFPRQIKGTEHRIRAFEQDIQTAKEHQSYDADKKLIFSIELDGKTYDKREDAGKALLGLVGAAVRATKPVPVGHYAGFEITVEYKPLEKVFHAHLVGEATHTTELGNDAAGNMIRFQNVVSALPQDLNRLHGSLEQLTKQLTNAEEELKQPFLQEQELSDKSARLAELDALLNVGNDAPIIEGEAEELEEEPEDALIQSDDELER